MVTSTIAVRPRTKKPFFHDITSVEYCPGTKHLRLLTGAEEVLTVPNCSTEMLEVYIALLEVLLAKEFNRTPWNRNLDVQGSADQLHPFAQGRERFVGVVHVYYLT